MKHSAIISTILTMSAALCGCSGSKSPYHDEVVAAAYRDAEKVIVSAPGSMDREHAVLAIRVRQHALSANGHADEAELYYLTAHHILVDSLHIIECREIDSSEPINL